MPAYNWQTDPFGYMGDNSPNFIAAGQPEYARGDLNSEARRIQQGEAPTYNPILAQGFNTIPAYDINKGQSYGEFLARETARTQAGANSGPYTSNPTLAFNFLNQTSNAIPTGPFRLPTYEDEKGVTYAIRPGMTSLPAGARNVTPNWQQLIGGGAAGWGNPGAPTFAAGQNIFSAPPVADQGQPVNPNPIQQEINRATDFSSYLTGGTPATAADPVQLPPYEVVDYTTRYYEPDTTDMTDLDRFYENGNPYVPNLNINRESTPEQLSSDQLTEAIQRAAETRINNASKVGPVSEADRNRIFQEEATRIVQTQAAVNAPQRIVDLSPGAGSSPAGSGQIPWVIPISGISPTQAILATILLNQIAGRAGGGAGYGGGTPASAGAATGSATGTTSTGGDAAAAAGAVIGTGTNPNQPGTNPSTTNTGTQQTDPNTGAVLPTQETPEERAAREERERQERERQARQLVFGTMGTPTTGTTPQTETGDSCPNGWVKNAEGVCAPVPFTGVIPAGADPTRGTRYDQPISVSPNEGCPDGMVKNQYGVCVYTGVGAVTPTGSTSTSTTTSSTAGSVIVTSTPTNPVSQNTTASLRNLLGEGSTTADALSKILPDIYRLYGQGAGSLAQSDLERLAGITGGNIFSTQNANLTKLAADQTAAANRALREGNIADAEEFSKRADVLRRAQNPELYDAMKQQQEVASGQVKTDLDRLAQAQARNLSPEDIRNAQQAAREAYSARGLVMGPGAIGAEILNRENLARQREQEARANLQTSLGNLGQTVGYRTANVFDPLGSTLSQQYGMQTGNQGLNQALFNQAAGISSGGYGYNYAQNLVNPFTPYTQDLYGTNVNALNAAAIANANRAAGLEAAKLGQSGTYAQALGSFLGSSTGQDVYNQLKRLFGIG